MEPSYSLPTDQRRRAKIVATLGPSCNHEPVFRELVRAGLDVARLNFSHGTQAEKLKLIEMVRARFIPGTSLIRYGNGDWNDSLQPVDPAKRDWMVSSWTVALLYEQLRRYAAMSAPKAKVVR